MKQFQILNHSTIEFLTSLNTVAFERMEVKEFMILHV